MYMHKKFERFVKEGNQCRDNHPYIGSSDTVVDGFSVFVSHFVSLYILAVLVSVHAFTVNYCIITIYTNCSVQHHSFYHCVNIIWS